MQGNLYSDNLQARRVTAAAVQALARTEAAQEVSSIRSQRKYLPIPSAAIAGTISMWSMYNVMLHQRATELVERPCREHGIDIQTLGEYPLFTGTKLVHGSLSDVVIVPADEDPLITSGKFPLPKQVAQRLRAIERAGVPFDMLHTYIAHEVPRYSVSEDGPIPLEIIAPPYPEQVVRLTHRLGTIAQVTTTLMGGLGRATKAAALGVGALTAGTANAASILLDPLIFGAIADERGMATWFVLAQWAW